MPAFSQSLETCRVTFHQCSLLILNQTDPRQTAEVSGGDSLVPQTIRERVSDQLLKCIQEYFECVMNQFGVCARGYHRCTLGVLDSQIQGESPSPYNDDIDDDQFIVVGDHNFDEGTQDQVSGKRIATRYQRKVYNSYLLIVPSKLLNVYDFGMKKYTFPTNHISSCKKN